MAVAALIAGILGVTIFFGVAAIFALIFGYVARGQIKRSQGLEGGSGMAMTGIVLGWVGTIISLLLIVLAFAGAIALFGLAQSDEFRDGVESTIEDVAGAVVEESLTDVSEAEAECTPVESYPSMGAEHIRPGESHEPYNSNPPTSGPHWAVPADAGFYEPSSVVEPEMVVHNLEHGQIVIWYRPHVNPFLEEQVETLVAQEPQATLGVPYEDMNEGYNIVITSWTKARACVSASQQVVDDFRRRFQGRSPEPLTPRFRG